MSRLPQALREAFARTGCVGEPPGGAHRRGEARNAACGDVVVIWLRLADGRIERAGFRAAGCPAALATAAAICELLQGRLAAPASELQLREDFTARFGDPAPAHNHALTLVLAALRPALSDQPPAPSTRPLP